MFLCSNDYGHLEPAVNVKWSLAEKAASLISCFMGSGSIGYNLLLCQCYKTMPYIRHHGFVTWMFEPVWSFGCGVIINYCRMCIYFVTH